MGKIKLVATDIDGTLFNSEKKPPSDFVDWVKAHPEVTVVLASGRQYYNLYAMFPEIADNLMYLAENGAVVFKGKEALLVKEIPFDTVMEAIKYLAEKKGIRPILCGVKEAYAEAGDDVAIANARLYYAKLSTVDSLESVAGKDKIVKIAIYVHDFAAEKLYRELDDAPFLLRAGLIRVLSGKDWVDIQQGTVGKGEAIKSIQEKLQIKREECMAFGDFLNDMTLLEECGESYCMENGRDELKAISKHIAPSCDDNGVMKVLRKVIG